MGGSPSTSRNQTTTTYYNSPSEQVYNFYTIDDDSLNRVLQDNRHRLSYASQNTIHYAMEKVTEQLKRTMRNCTLTLQLEEVTIKIISGDGCNRITVYRDDSTGQYKFYYANKGFVQGCYDTARSVGSAVVGFFRSLVPQAITWGMRAIGW